MMALSSSCAVIIPVMFDWFLIFRIFSIAFFSSAGIPRQRFSRRVSASRMPTVCASSVISASMFLKMRIEFVCASCSRLGSYKSPRGVSAEILLEVGIATDLCCALHIGHPGAARWRREASQVIFLTSSGSAMGSCSPTKPCFLNTLVMMRYDLIRPLAFDVMPHGSLKTFVRTN